MVLKIAVYSDIAHSVFCMLKFSPTSLIINAKINLVKFRVWPKSSEANAAMKRNSFAGYFFMIFFL